MFRLADMLTPRGLGRARERAERVSSAHKSSLAKEERASSGHKSSLAKEQAVGGEEGVASGTGERDEGGGGLQAHPLSPGLTEATAGPPTPSVTAGPATPSVTVGSGLSPGEEGRREDLGSPSREEVSFRMDAASE